MCASGVLSAVPDGAEKNFHAAVMDDISLRGFLENNL